MRVTVAICTWNRCALLRQTLESVAHLVIPSGLEWELIVVNNRSTDATDSVITEFERRLPIRRIFEAEAGLSNARNAAISEARGDYIVWTDDDVSLDQAWLAEYLTAFQRWPAATFFGGPIDPWFEGTPPAWLVSALARVGAAYGRLNLGSDPLRLTTKAFPYGANMALKRTVYQTVRYDPNLGVRPGSSLRGEEMALAQYLTKTGDEGWWVPAARVKHFIPKSRQTVAYLRSYYFGWGEYLGRGAERPRGHAILGRPLWLWREAIEEETRYRLTRMLGRPDRWVGNLAAASTAWGRLRWYGAGFSR